MIEDKRGDGTYEGLGDNDGGVQLEGTERTFNPNWREDTSEYLWGVRRCGSSATEKGERQRKRELEKLASQIQSIVEMFSAQFNKNKPDNTDPTPDSSSSLSAPKGLQREAVKKGEIQVEL